MANKTIKTLKDKRTIAQQIKDLRVIMKSILFVIEKNYGLRFDIYPLVKPLNSKVRTMGDWKLMYNNQGELNNV